MSVEAGKQWDELVARFHAAQDEANAAQAIINKKFAAIAAGTSRENPTTEELLNADVAFETVAQVRREMDGFIASHFGRN
jgi:hypothetical protein